MRKSTRLIAPCPAMASIGLPAAIPANKWQGLARYFIHGPYASPSSTQDLSAHELRVLEDRGFPILPKQISLGDNLAIVAGEVGVLLANALAGERCTPLAVRTTLKYCYAFSSPTKQPCLIWKKSSRSLTKTPLPLWYNGFS